MGGGADSSSPGAEPEEGGGFGGCRSAQRACGDYRSAQRGYRSEQRLRGDAERDRAQPQQVGAGEREAGADQRRARSAPLSAYAPGTKIVLSPFTKPDVAESAYVPVPGTDRGARDLRGPRAAATAESESGVGENEGGVSESGGGGAENGGGGRSSSGESEQGEPRCDQLRASLSAVTNRNNRREQMAWRMTRWKQDEEQESCVLL
eukprot:1602319-Rhodomonas_salina.1